MDTQTISPETAEERIVWHSIRATYAFYIIGALYIVAPVIGWLLLLMLLKRFWHSGHCNPALPNGRLPLTIWLWIGGMLVMLLALIVGHLDFELGTGKTIKSTIGWAKGWALLAIFPLLGCLDIRPQIIYRASMHVCLHTLLLLPLFIGAWLAGLPQTPYVSPLQVVGGPGPEFFALSLYELDPGTGSPRWRLFTPWAPALGFVANIFFIFALQEQNRRWYLTGIAGSVLMVVMSGSRLALLSLLIVWGSTWLIGRLRSPLAPFVAALGSTFIGLIGVSLFDAIERFWQAFRAARANSTRVREALGRIALDRWSGEAPVWGHGIVERGPRMVEFMPIGSHHSWYGLLFVKGMVGVMALAIPLFCSVVQLGWWSGRLRLARAGLAMGLLLLLYTFGENLEILAYLIWPALMVMGMAHRDISIAAHQPAALPSTLTGEPRHA
jgi:hypothetical protein